MSKFLSVKINMTEADENGIVELNVGGSLYSTTLKTLTKDPNSLLAKYFSNRQLDHAKGLSITRLSDQENRYFIDRNGDMFKYILDYLRNDCRLVLPDRFNEHNRLKSEAKFYKLDELAVKVGKLRHPSVGCFSLPSIDVKLDEKSAASPSSENGLAQSGGRVLVTQPNYANAGHIMVGYRGTFAFGRDGKADVKFRKLNRILIAGKATLCREVFGDTLNESRDPDRTGENRYTSRLYLKHCNLECAFDMLAECGFCLLASCASGTCFLGADGGRGSIDGEEQKWNHYNEFVFFRGPE